MDLHTNILPSTKYNRHTHRSVSNSTDIYVWHTSWFMDLYTDFSQSTFLPSYQTQPTHLPNYTHRPMLNLTTVANQHTSQGTKLSRHTYQTTCTNRCEPNSVDTPTELSTPTNVEFNDCNWSTFLPRYRTQPTHLPNWMHQPMLNLPTVTDQHSSQGTELSQHTYQTKCTSRCERNNCSWSTFLPRYQTQLTHLPN